jgi:hypothetical protein
VKNENKLVGGRKEFLEHTMRAAFFIRVMVCGRVAGFVPGDSGDATLTRVGNV